MYIYIFLNYTYIYLYTYIYIYIYIYICIFKFIHNNIQIKNYHHHVPYNGSTWEEKSTTQ